MRTKKIVCIVAGLLMLGNAAMAEEQERPFCYGQKAIVTILDKTELANTGGYPPILTILDETGREFSLRGYTGMIITGSTIKWSDKHRTYGTILIVGTESGLTLGGQHFNQGDILRVNEQNQFELAPVGTLICVTGNVEILGTTYQAGTHLVVFSANRLDQEITKRKYSAIPTQKAQQLYKDIISKGDCPPRRRDIVGWPPAEWRFPDNPDVKGVNIKEKDGILLARTAGLKSVARFGKGRPKGFPEWAEFFLNYIFVLKTDLILIDSKLYSVEADGMIDPILKSGCYMWFFGPEGIWLLGREIEQDDFLIPFKNPLTGKLREAFEKDDPPPHIVINLTILSEGKGGILIELPGDNRLFLR